MPFRSLSVVLAQQVATELKKRCNIVKVKVFMKAIYSIEEPDFVTNGLSAPKFASMVSKDVAYASTHVIKTYIFMQLEAERGAIKLAP